MPLYEKVCEITVALIAKGVTCLCYQSMIADEDRTHAVYLRVTQVSTGRQIILRLKDFDTDLAKLLQRNPDWRTLYLINYGTNESLVKDLIDILRRHDVDFSHDEAIITLRLGEEKLFLLIHSLDEFNPRK